MNLNPNDPVNWINGDIVLHRAISEMAESENETGVLVGVIAPYGIETEIAPGVFETFKPGTFSAATRAPSRIKVKGIGHSLDVIGHALELIDSETNISGKFKISQTRAGIDALTLLRDGAIDELSCEFQPMAKGFRVERDSAGNLHITHSRARLLGVSPVPMGAYGRESRVVSVRDSNSDKREAILARLNSFHA